jgi:hypothetical protein
MQFQGSEGTGTDVPATPGALPPLMLKTNANPGGLPPEAFDGIRAGVAADRSHFFKDLMMPFYGVNRPGAKVAALASRSPDLVPSAFRLLSLPCQITPSPQAV